jgi:hypothetical protein
MGTVALGPAYGRVKVAEHSVIEAEAAILRQLKQTVNEPAVQVTFMGRGYYQPPSAVPSFTAQFAPVPVPSEKSIPTDRYE